MCNPFFFLLVDSVFGSACGACAWASEPGVVLAFAAGCCAVEAPLCEAVDAAVAGSGAGAAVGGGAVVSAAAPASDGAGAAAGGV